MYIFNIQLRAPSDGGYTLGIYPPDKTVRVDLPFLLLLFYFFVTHLYTIVPSSFMWKNPCDLA